MRSARRGTVPTRSTAKPLAERSVAPRARFLSHALRGSRRARGAVGGARRHTRVPVVAPSCLSVNLDDAGDCPGSRARLIDEAIFSAESDATASAGAGFVDLTDYFCNARSCPPIIGDTLVYSDEHHLTATFTAQLAPALDAALGAYLPAMD